VILDAEGETFTIGAVFGETVTTTEALPDAPLYVEELLASGV
jgi:hypothetical protein